jgi:glycine cleavage system H protein
MQHPTDLRYTPAHEWARQGATSITIGITAFAVNQLGDITLVELPQVGTHLGKGDTFGTIESVKSVSEIYAPVAGKVVRVNDALEEGPELVNESPYEQGWMVEIEPAGDDFAALLDASAYGALVATDE